MNKESREESHSLVISAACYLIRAHIERIERWCHASDFIMRATWMKSNCGKLEVHWRMWNCENCVGGRNVNDNETKWNFFLVQLSFPQLKRALTRLLWCLTFCSLHIHIHIRSRWKKIFKLPLSSCNLHRNVMENSREVEENCHWD